MLEDAGYKHLREIDDKIYGTNRFLFTHGLMVGLDGWGYEGRYCYSSEVEALHALDKWDGKGDPSGNWIKYKGKNGERSNGITVAM